MCVWFVCAPDRLWLLGGFRFGGGMGWRWLHASLALAVGQVVGVGGGGGGVCTLLHEIRIASGCVCVVGLVSVCCVGA